MNPARCVVPCCSLVDEERASSTKDQVMAKLNSEWNELSQVEQDAMKNKKGGDFSR